MYLPTESQSNCETALTYSIVNSKKQTINIDPRWGQRTWWEEKVERDWSQSVTCTTWEAELQQQPQCSQISVSDTEPPALLQHFPLLHSRSSAGTPLDNAVIKNSQRWNIPGGKCGYITSGCRYHPKIGYWQNLPWSQFSLIQDQKLSLYMVKKSRSNIGLTS